jgi:aspartyl-tRNA synthetase
MSFVTQEDFFNELETLMVKIFKELSTKKIVWETFPQIPYREAVEKYGTDKPDLRYGLEIQDCTDIFAHSELKVFSAQVTTGGVIKVIRLPHADQQARMFLTMQKNMQRVKGLRVWHGLS